MTDKTAITIVLAQDVRKKLEKRAKKELMSIEDLIAEILRRSVLSYKGSSQSDNVDDKFISFFSRKTKSRKSKSDSNSKPIAKQQVDDDSSLYHGNFR